MRLVRRRPLPREGHTNELEQKTLDFEVLGELTNRRFEFEKKAHTTTKNFIKSKSQYVRFTFYKIQLVGCKNRNINLKQIIRESVQKTDCLIAKICLGIVSIF